MKAILLETQYLPSVAYFSAIAQADRIIIEAHENFEKQTYRNRCTILTSTKQLSLSVPVHHQGKKVNIQKLEIDYLQKWQNNHWRSIRTAYRNAPFFEYYSDALQEILYSNTPTLFDLNCQLLTICLKFLQFDTPIEYSKEYMTDVNDDVIDMRSVIHPKKALSSIKWFAPRRYHQIFGPDFASNMSIVDLLFCEGPASLEVLKSSIVTNKN